MIKLYILYIILFISFIKSNEDEIPIEWRSYNGEGNNIKNQFWGSQFQTFSRLTKPNVFNAFSSPTFYNNIPTSREISNMVFYQDELISSREHLSDMFNMWGQFIIHNMALSRPLKLRWDVPVPKCDQYFDPQCLGNQSLAYTRTRIAEVSCADISKTVQDPQDGKCYEQVNSLSSFIDANVIYGSDKVTADALRLQLKGSLKHSENQFGIFPPKGIPQIQMDNDASIFPVDQLFFVGERRGNENPGLMSLHVVFLREHIRLAKEFAEKNSNWTDEEIYQHTRSCIIHDIQKITYEEYLPVLFGGPLPPYQGYNPQVNPAISNEFTTAAFRYGHSEVGPNIEYIDEHMQPMKPLPIKFSYFNPTAMEIAGVEPILRGLIFNEEQSIDIFIINDLRNFLFGKPGSGGLDLVSRNLQRGRDHGLPLYSETRRQLGLRPVNTWSDISSNIVIQNRLKNAYGDINKVELFAGGIAEDHYENSVVGQTFLYIIREQFLRTRQSDRFWYERPEMKSINKDCPNLSLSQIIKLNTKNMNNLPDNPFVINKR